MASTLLDRPAPAVDVRLVDATLRCIARWGVAKTSLDDVARDARCSRATVYRAFPGGKEALLDAVVQTEVHRFLDRVAAEVGAAPDLEDALVGVIAAAGSTIAGHEALQYVLEHEPELVLPRLAFRELDDMLRMIRSVGGPLLSRFVPDPEKAERVAEWVARITLSYTLSPTAGVNTAEAESVRTLVRTFVLPGIANL